MYEKSIYVNLLVVCDGEFVFVMFLNGGRVYVIVFDLEGEIVWIIDVGGFVLWFGYVFFLIIYGLVLIIVVDYG